MLAELYDFFEGGGLDVGQVDLFDQCGQTFQGVVDAVKIYEENVAEVEQVEASALTGTPFRNMIQYDDDYVSN